MNRKFIMVMCKFIYIENAYICIEKMYTEKRKIKKEAYINSRETKSIMRKKSVHRYFMFPNFEIMFFTINLGISLLFCFLVMNCEKQNIYHNWTYYVLTPGVR